MMIKGNPITLPFVIYKYQISIIIAVDMSRSTVHISFYIAFYHKSLFEQWYHTLYGNMYLIHLGEYQFQQ